MPSIEFIHAFFEGRSLPEIRYLQEMRSRQREEPMMEAFAFRIKEVS